MVQLKDACLKIAKYEYTKWYSPKDVHRPDLKTIQYIIASAITNGRLSDSDVFFSYSRRVRISSADQSENICRESCPILSDGMAWFIFIAFIFLRAPVRFSEWVCSEPKLLFCVLHKYTRHRVRSLSSASSTNEERAALCHNDNIKSR